MRRERRNFNGKPMDIKKVLYITGGILSLAVIAFSAIFILNGVNTNDSTQIARFNTSIVDE